MTDSNMIVPSPVLPSWFDADAATMLRRATRALRAAYPGCTFRGHDEEGDEIHPHRVSMLVAFCDIGTDYDDVLIFDKGGKQISWVTIVPSNGEDAISDYGVSLSPILDRL